MKPTLLFSVFIPSLLLSGAALGAPGGFSCERIKEKSVRESCLKARIQEQANNAESERLAAEEKRQVAEREKELAVAAAANKARGEFVAKSKLLIVQNLKDPDSAKFTNVVIAARDGQKLLCGAINAKNSYGGYVGAKKFYVRWTDASPGEPIAYTEGDEVARARARIEELAKVGSSSGLGAQIAAAQEGDKVIANARVEVAQNEKILSEQCTASAGTTITSVE